MHVTYVTFPWPHYIYIDTCYIRLWFSNNITENLSFIQKLVGLYCGTYMYTIYMWIMQLCICTYVYALMYTTYVHYTDCDYQQRNTQVCVYVLLFRGVMIHNLGVSIYNNTVIYRIAGKFDGEFNLTL